MEVKKYTRTKIGVLNNIEVSLIWRFPYYGGQTIHQSISMGPK